MSLVIKPPASMDHPRPATLPVAFLAGSIEMGSATNWQTVVEERFRDLSGIILNPRRDAWDSSWEQDISNPVFAEQVRWELDGLGLADLIMMYFDPSTMSPITLMELGILTHSMNATQDLLVACPPGFWRRGNVQVVCERYGIRLYDSLDRMVDTGRAIFREKRGQIFQDAKQSTVECSSCGSRANQTYDEYDMRADWSLWSTYTRSDGSRLVKCPYCSADGDEAASEQLHT